MSVLFEVRTRLSELNINELQVSERQPALKEMWQNLQDAKLQMNTAILNAVRQASEPFEQKIKELEKQYAFLLRLSA